MQTEPVQSLPLSLKIAVGMLLVGWFAAAWAIGLIEEQEVPIKKDEQNEGDS